MFGLKLYLHESAPEMSSGFRMRSSMGMVWRAIRRCSRVFEFWIDVMWVGNVPR